ncbi:Scr1 family TA system antitoxin-like transcriptional regulator [Streptomyces sp. NPDC005955]|uniref:Scr1 family TA system antitoxin-like transcriptional regulator n=1 Tax=Streptomyces sp. NPDC005955 TaxID=3364738 RepID=UPI003683DA27
MTNASTPPISWSYCGDQIKMWRQISSVTREALSDEANYHIDYVKAMENGRRKPTVQLLNVADQLCGAKGLLIAAQKFLKPDPYPQRSHEYMDAEAKAVVYRSYEPLLIPGLLQTEGYARALITAYMPFVDEDTIEERTAGRMLRQRILRDGKPPVSFSFVLYEAALRATVGDREIMRQQLHHLWETQGLRNVSIQVLPAGRCDGIALNGSIVLMQDAEGERLGYVEGPQTNVIHDDQNKVSALSQAYGRIRSQALTMEESADYIRRMAEER